jgi:hypothetical protein
MIKRKYRIAYLTYSFVESCITCFSFLIAYLVRKQLPSPWFGPLFRFSLHRLRYLSPSCFGTFLARDVAQTGVASDPLDVIKEVTLTVLTGSVLIGAAIFI